MKKIIILIAFICIFLLFGFMQKKTPKYYVPNKETAIKVAEAIWLPIYGNKIYNKKPFIATLINDSIWKVEGTLNTAKGGVPYIEIMKSDCKILKVTHTK